MSRSPSARPGATLLPPGIPRRWPGVAAIAVAALALAGCSAAPTPAPLSVYAAASLDPVLTQIADDFHADNPTVDVAPIVFDGSSTLVTQISEGAPADVLVTADEATMATLGDAATDTRVVAENVMTIAVQPGNPHDIQTLADLADPALSVVLCAPEVPCGAVATTLLDAAHVTVTAASAEQNVTAVARKVELGDADAGLVYRTDIERSGAVDAVEIAGAAAAPNRYPAAMIAASDQPDSAAAFLRFLGGDRARARFLAAGFLPPR